MLQNTAQPNVKARRLQIKVPFCYALLSYQVLLKLTPSPECFLHHFIFRLQLRLFWSKSITEKWALPFTFAKGWEINLRSIKAEVSVGINFHLTEFINSHRIPQFLAVLVAQREKSSSTYPSTQSNWARSTLHWPCHLDSAEAFPALSSIIM